MTVIFGVENNLLLIVFGFMQSVKYVRSIEARIEEGYISWLIMIRGQHFYYKNLRRNFSYFRLRCMKKSYVMFQIGIY